MQSQSRYRATSDRRNFSSWETSETSNQSHRQISTIAEDDNDNFTAVSRHRRRRSPHAAVSQGRTRRTSRSSNSPPSAAATSRANVYAPRSRANSEKELAGKAFKMPRGDFRLGMIVRAPVHEQDARASNMTTADKYTTDSRFGPIYTKYRKMIIVGLYQDHYLAAPLYTHNGQGLANKANPDEFVSVRDHRFDGYFAALSCHQPLITNYFNPGIYVMDPMTTAHITYPLSRRYNLPIVFEGCIDEESISRMVNIFNKSMTIRY